MFQLSKDENQSLRSQFVILKIGRGQHRKYLPYVFTEQGVSMLSSVLRSKRAIRVNIGIMRVFVRLREWTSVNRELANRLNDLERHIESHDDKIAAIFEAIRDLVNPLEKLAPRIGFRPGNR